MSIEIKNQKIEKVPKEWEVVSLGEILILLRNGLTASQNKKGNGYPISRIETISEEKINPAKVGYTSEIEENDLQEYKLIDGDILFSHINSLEHIGKTAIYQGIPDGLLHGMNLLLLRSDRKKVKPVFLLYLLRLFRLKATFRNMSKKAVNQASINQTELGRFKIPLPPLPEQQKIAEFLCSFDEDSRKTDQAIDKTRRFKKGLMQVLLTRGIGHKEFKDTEAGRIPKEWEIFVLAEIGEIITGTTPSTKVEEYWGEGYPFVTPSDFSEAKYVYNTERSVTRQGINKARLIPKDSVMVTCIASVGEVSMASTECITNQQINTILCNEKVNPHYVYYTMVFRRNILKRWAGLTTSPIIKKSLFEKFPVPVPPPPEQQRIAEILSTVDARLELLRRRRARLERVKKGLMHDLLTGGKRVLITS